MFDYIKTITGTELFINTYDYLDDVVLAKNRELELLQPLLFKDTLEKVIQNLINISTIENPFLEEYNEHLFEVNESEYGTFTEQKGKLIYYAEYLLSRSSEGRYFVRDRD